MNLNNQQRGGGGNKQNTLGTASIAVNKPQQNSNISKAIEENNKNPFVCQTQNKPTKLKKVGEYIFIKQIGSGAYSTVHQGKHNNTYQKVAIKMISTNQLNEKVYNRVISEIKILRSLNHKNIVKIIDSKKTTQNYYLIFEFCQNGDLESYIKKHYEGKLSENLCQQVIFQVRDAFKQLTHHKIVHRDLKLANILVDEQFTIKIADFGFAKHNQDDDLLRSTLGTPITMAPEILSCNSYNQKCDIWSLGVIIYQMIFGKPPFMPVKGGGIQGLIKEIKKEVFTFPEDIPISDELKNLLKQMLTVNPLKRIEFQELFQNKWITGEFKPGMKDKQGNQINEDIDLTQSLKQKKELQQKQNTDNKMKIQQQMQQNPQQSFEETENGEDEQKNQLQNENEDNQEKVNYFKNKDIDETTGINNFTETQTQQDDNDLIVQTIDNINQETPTLCPIQEDEKEIIDDQLCEKVLISGVMKLTLTLRKHYEKKIITFLANCNKYIDYYEKAENSIYFNKNYFYRYSVFLNSILITQRITQFINGNINVKINQDTFDLGSYQQFSGFFLKQGESDANNYIHVLKKKLTIFKSIVLKLQNYDNMPISDNNSPEFLFLQNILKAYSFHKATSSSEDGQLILKELSELLEIMEKLQLPSLQLNSQVRKQGIDTKKIFGEIKNIIDIIQNVIKVDKKYVKYQNYPIEIKINTADLPNNELQFIEIQKKVFNLINSELGILSINSLNSINTEFN